MPSGKTHDRLTVVTAAAAVPVWWLYAPDRDVPALVVTLAAYVFSGFWLSDDLDTNSIAYKRWGALRFLWWPYRKTRAAPVVGVARPGGRAAAARGLFRRSCWG